MVDTIEDRALDWDDEISKDSLDYMLLPDGDYAFVIIDCERDRFVGSEKLPACSRATVHLRIEVPEGQTIIRHQLFLHTRTEGLLCAFFKAIGQRQQGEKQAMNWAKVKGATGRVQVGRRTYEGKEYNEVKRFLDPPPVLNYTPGKF
jgi:hypothetical protein